MSANTCLAESVKRTHDGLAECLELARRVSMDGTTVRRGSPQIDGLLVRTSAHLHAVDQIMVPAARRARARGAVQDYRRASRRLGVSVAHAKAHEFGSSYEAGVAWSTVWGDMEDALTAERRCEEAMVTEMEAADLGSFQTLTDRLEQCEVTSPTRPHPYLPHGGPAGHVMRWMMRRVDHWWDRAEGRFVPEPERPPRRRLGLVGQYLTGTPHMADETDEDSSL